MRYNLDARQTVDVARSAALVACRLTALTFGFTEVLGTLHGHDSAMADATQQLPLANLLPTWQKCRGNYRVLKGLWHGGPA